jgi:hypothetical protein
MHHLRIIFIVLSFFSSLSLNAVQTDWSLSLEYALSEKTHNPWGDVTVSCDRNVHDSENAKSASFGISYKNIPGLLGDWGHLRVDIKTHTTDPLLIYGSGLFNSQADKLLDENPELLKYYDKVIAQNARIKLNQKKRFEQSEQERVKQDLERITKRCSLIQAAHNALYGTDEDGDSYDQ